MFKYKGVDGEIRYVKHSFFGAVHCVVRIQIKRNYEVLIEDEVMCSAWRSELPKVQFSNCPRSYQVYAEHKQHCCMNLCLYMFDTLKDSDQRKVEIEKRTSNNVLKLHSCSTTGLRRCEASMSSLANKFKFCSFILFA